MRRTINEACKKCKHKDVSDDQNPCKDCWDGYKWVNFKSKENGKK